MEVPPLCDSLTRLADSFLKRLGVQLNPRKTRMVHIRRGFEFFGYRIKVGVGCGLHPIRGASLAVGSFTVCSLPRADVINWRGTAREHR